MGDANTMRFRLIQGFLLIFTSFISIYGVNIKPLGSFQVDNAAFVTLYEKKNPAQPSEKYDFIVSTFSAAPFATGSVQIVINIGNYIKAVDNIKADVVTTKTVWPNEVAGVPGMQ